MTVPVGPAPPEVDIVAVSEICWPRVDGFCEVVKEVALGIATSCSSAVDVLPRNVPSPRYDAVMVWLPCDKVALMNANPFVKDTGWPKFAPSTANCTFPLGTKEVWVCGDTVPVRVIS